MAMVMAAAGLLLPVADAAKAQIASDLPDSVPAARRALTAPSQPKFDFRIETPGRSSVPRSVDEIRFALKGIEIKGATSIPAERFKPFFQSLIGKDVSLPEILDVATAIENEYRGAGFVLVRAFVPPQRVANGMFTINVVEGYIAKVTVQGARPGTRNRIRGYLDPARASRPLKLGVVEQGLLLANDLPGVTAAGVLRPSADTPGASELVVTVPDNRVSGQFSVDNRGSRFSGIWSATAALSANAILDDEDQLEATAAAALDSSPLRRGFGQIRYWRPVGERGGMVSLAGTLAHGEPGSTLQILHVLTDSWAVGPRLVFPLARTRAQTVQLEGGLTVQEARQSILGTRLSRDAWRVADIGLSYSSNQFLDGGLTANIDMAQGLPFLAASQNGSPDLSRPDGRVDFTKITAGFRFVRPLVAGFDILAAAQGQYAFNPLLVGEQFAFGAQIGRGYDPGALTGDHGLGGTIELRYDPQLRMPMLQALQPYLFFDAAGIWYANNYRLPAQSIESVGGGLRAWLQHDLFADVEVAHTLKAVPGSDGGRRTTKLLVNLSVGF